MQLLTRNPLADPYVLGLSGGASVGALLISGSARSGGALLLPSGASRSEPAPGRCAAARLFLLSWRLLGRTDRARRRSRRWRLLLVGVMIGTACSAFVSMLLVLASEMHLRGMVFWLLGDLNGAHRRWGVRLVRWLVALGARVADRAASSTGLPAAMRGRQTSGFRSSRRRSHRARRRRRSRPARRSRRPGDRLRRDGGSACTAVDWARPAAILLPASALGGGSFVVLADAVARTVVAPVQLPVGVIAAAVGVPSFLFLLLQGGRRRMQ
jgi:iron complex transport system permease protein